METGKQELFDEFGSAYKIVNGIFGFRQLREAIKIWKKNYIKQRNMKMATGSLYTDIKNILEQARANAVRAVNFSMVVAYWEIGRRIVEEEQQGEERAGYGEAVLKALSKQLTIDFGKGFSVVSLENFRKFYQVFSDK